MTTLMMDHKSKCPREKTPKLNLNMMADNKHVPYIERHIRILKEKTQSICSMLPFKRIYGWMIVDSVKHTVVCLKTFP